MKLNRIEKALMNNPVRAFLQKNYEANLLERLGGLTKHERVLEIGCGRGVGAEIMSQEVPIARDSNRSNLVKRGRYLEYFCPCFGLCC